MFTIRKTFTFSASHRLDHLPEAHQCARLHGHNYAVTIELRSSRLNDDGFVLDYGKLSESFGAYLKDHVDHRHLNELWGGSRQTTAENLASTFYVLANDVVRGLSDNGPFISAVEVKETDGTCARFEP